MVEVKQPKTSSLASFFSILRTLPKSSPNFIMLSFWAFMVFSLFSTHSYAATSAKIRGMVANFDNLDRDSDRELVELTGNIQIIREGEHIKCDRAVIHMRSEQIELYGNVTIVSAQASMSGEYILMDYSTGTGLIYGGSVQSGQVFFEGKIIQKTGPMEFLATDSDYTTCTDCPATWSFQGSNIRAELGGYAYIKNAVMRVGGFPVLWLPYLVVPLKSDRQSGLLTPALEQSTDGGLTVSESYFWAINRSTDATFTLKNYERRSLKTLLNYRYMLDENSEGEFDTALVNDKFFANSERLNAYRPLSSQDEMVPRWFIKYKNLFTLPDNMTQRVQVNHASDLQYPQDFPLETGNHGDTAMEDRVSLSQTRGDYYWHFDSSYYTNLLRRNPLASNDDAVHRLPEIQVSQMQKQIGDTNFVYQWDATYTNFHRNMQGWDDLSTPRFSDWYNKVPIRYVTSNPDIAVCENLNPDCERVFDGSFQAGRDLIRTGQRLDFSPSLSYPITYLGLEVVPQLSYRETRYSFNIDNVTPAYRRIIRAQIQNSVTFSHIYRGEEPQSNALKHEMIPKLIYTRAPWIDQSNHPFFGFNEQTFAAISSRDSISDGDLGTNTGLQFDYDDRIYDSNLITLGLLNRWTQKRWSNGVPEYRQIVAWSVAQSYDAYQASLNDSSRPGWSDLSSTLSVSLDQWYGRSSINYYPYQQVSNTSSRVQYNRETGEFVQLGLTNQYKIVPGQDVDTSTRTEDYTGGLGFVSRYINLMGKLVYDANYQNNKKDSPIKSWAYITQLKPPGDCWMITFIYDQVTGGDTNYRINFEFNFDGSPLKALPASTLDSFGF